MNKQSQHNHRRRHRRRQHAAMKEDEIIDESRHRARTGRGEKPSDRQDSSTRRPSRDSESRARHHSPPHRDHSTSRSRRHRSRERHSHKEHHQSKSQSVTRDQEVKEDLIPRYRERKERERVEKEKATRERSRSRSRSHSRGRHSEREKERRAASPHSRRPRSRSAEGSHKKRSRREHSTSRHRDRSEERSSKKRRRSSHERKKSSSHSHHSHSRKSPERSEKHRYHSRSKRSRSRSPSKADSKSKRGRNDSRHERHDSHRHRSTTRSPRRSPSSRHYTRSPKDIPREKRATSSAVDSRGGEIDRYISKPRDLSPAQPGGIDRYASKGREPSPAATRPDRRRRDENSESYYSSRPDPEDDMAARGSYRGGYHPGYGPKSSYNGDSRGYSPSPQYGGSYHNSPSHSPHGNRGGWNGPQYSPPHQYPQYHQGPPPGPSSHYNEPPYATPTGPSLSHHPPSSYRGNPRGTGFRGSFSGRGHRGSNFKSGQWTQGPPPEENGPVASEHDNYASEKDGIPKGPKAQEGSQGPPSTAPSGPAAHSQGGPKFSFAFKGTSKTATVPKPEISQKFNAAPKPPPARTDDREPPNNAPTGPSKARSPDETRAPPTGPRMAPRMRKVKKIMKRPKPRPQLPTELVESDSVYYRKPGNESVIGSGTYGKVFKGLNVYTKGLVALKRIRMEGERDGFPVTAVREIKLLQSLRHVNIVKLQEVMVEKNDCFMVFEYLSHDLTGLLNHPFFKLEAAQKKHLAQQMFQGLDYLHTRGVLHRDIKAANILVSNEGILKIADFGLARFYAKRHQLDYTNRVITIWYRSPELLLGETKYTAAVDVWSTACVMVEIFAKNPVFAGDGTEISQIEKIYSVMGTPNRQDWPNLSDMAWFELLRPSARRKSMFAELYKDKLTPAAFELLSAMFCYDPAKRPTAAEVLKHRYFTEEEPAPRQAKELSDIDGDWHEHESKALRKERERQEREARKAKEASAAANSKDKLALLDKKRAVDSSDGQQRDSKRQALEPPSKVGETTKDV